MVVARWSSDRSVPVSVYRLNDRNDYVGFGANWGRPPKGTTAGKTRNQYTLEAYYRFQVLPQVQIVPSVQLIFDPAYEPTHDTLRIPGLRVRATF